MEKSIINNLNDQLESSLKKAKIGKVLLNIFKLPTYLFALVFLVFIFFNMLTAGKIYQHINPNDVQRYMLIVFGIFVVSQMIFMKCFAYFSTIEANIIKKIIKTLFPAAKYYDAQEDQINDKFIKSSKLFPKYEKANNFVKNGTFGCIRLPTSDKMLKIYDIGVSFGTTKALMNSNGISAYFMAIYAALLKPLFWTRVENAMFNFRGMFSYAELKRDIGANVLIFPDHLEDKLGYLANNIQAMKTVYKNKLVKLEDIEFERAFAVYSDNEIASRRVLTPLMMRKLVELRNKFGRDIMLSFCNNTFYFAVNMPEGFLSLRTQDKKKHNIVAEIYEDITTAANILNETKN